MGTIPYVPEVMSNSAAGRLKTASVESERLSHKGSVTGIVEYTGLAIRVSTAANKTIFGEVSFFPHIWQEARICSSID